jgi:ribosomal protein L11 methylase PrmA
VANLPTDIQLLLAPHIATWLAPGGQVVVSGVWETWETTVVDAYLKEGFQIFSTDTQDGWCGFMFCKRKNTITP